MNEFVLFAEPWWVNLLIAIPFVAYFLWRKRGLAIQHADHPRPVEANKLCLDIDADLLNAPAAFSVWRQTSSGFYVSRSLKSS